MKKDYLIELNKKFSDGKLLNKNSFDFTIDYVNYEVKKELDKLCYLIRNMLTQHFFIDGNKRVSAILITNYFKKMKLKYRENQIPKICISIAKNNIRDIWKIRSMIQNAVR